MAAPRYPLARLATLRTGVATARVRDLAEAVAAETAAAAALAAAEAAVVRTTAAVRALAPATGPVPAWDLARTDAYRARLVGAAATARDRRDRRADALDVCQLDTAVARTAATAARGEREVVDRHRAGWDDDQRKARARAED